jgi:GAF domain-containing protein
VARGAVSILEVDQLIRQAVDLIRERFDLYYVGLFLLDAGRQFAVLRAGTGEAGQEMLAQGHRLEVGGDSMIGQCTAKAEAAIALDVGEEAVHFDNPLLPETRSEMALPLRSRGRVIGAVSVQSAEAAAFDGEDVSVMQTMADQVAVAIDNARLFAESQTALEAERRAYGEFSGKAWGELLRARTDWGYHYTRQAITPVEGDWRPEMREAERIGRSVQGNPERAEGEDGANGTALAIPIQVRGETVGVIGFRKGAGSETWMAEEVVLLETMVTQLGLALESAWLYQDTQQRAIREQVTAEVTGRIRGTLDMDTVLRTAAQEIREVLGLHDVKIQMQVLGQDS